MASDKMIKELVGQMRTDAHTLSVSGFYLRHAKLNISDKRAQEAEDLAMEYYALAERIENECQPSRVITEPTDLILEPGAGARIQQTFADARRLVALTEHSVVVRGNGVDVEVTACMDDAACQKAYESALEKHGPA